MNKPLPGSEYNLRVVQRNALRAITITDVGPEVANILGTNADELRERALVSIFPRRINEIISENMEFEADSADISEILRKISRFTVKTYDGSEVPVVIKINPDGVDAGDVAYCLSIKPESDELSRQDKRILASRLYSGRDYVANDKATGLPDKITFLRDVEMAHHIVRNDGADATVGVIINTAGHADIIKLAGVCRRILRNDDVVARFGENVLGFLLADTHKNNAPIAFQRLRLAMQADNIIDVMIAYDGLNPMEKSDKFTSRLEGAAKNLKYSAGQQSVLPLP